MSYYAQFLGWYYGSPSQPAPVDGHPSEKTGVQCALARNCPVKGKLPPSLVVLTQKELDEAISKLKKVETNPPQKYFEPKNKLVIDLKTTFAKRHFGKALLELRQLFQRREGAEKKLLIFLHKE